MKSNRLVSTLLGLGVLFGALGSPLTVAAAPAARTYKVLTWNIAGEKINNAKTSALSYKVVTDAVVSLAKAQAADVIMLQEVCRGQYDDLKSLLKSQGWYSSTTNKVKFANQRIDYSDPSWCDGKDFGLAMFTKFEMGAGVTSTLPQASGDAESRKILCALPSNDSSIQLCVTHATSKGAGVPSQLSYIRTQIIQPAVTRGVGSILGGDLNADPTHIEFDNWYSPSLLVNRVTKGGSMVEAQENRIEGGLPTYGQWTATSSSGVNRKIDFIWSVEARTVSYGGSVVATPTGCLNTKSQNLPPTWTDLTSCSDHRPLIGSIVTS